MQRWPNVPAAFGWLRLDRRGQWYLINRSAASFDPQRDIAGSIVRNERFIDYIARNYQANELGQWYFQNGPQKVFANLELAPLVWRIDNSSAKLKWVSHIGSVGYNTLAAAQDSLGNIYIQTELGVGVVDDRHLGRLVDWLVETGPQQSGLKTDISTNLASILPLPLVDNPAKHFGFVVAPSLIAGDSH